MESRFKKPVITIVGPTASGKTGLAIKLATKINGEIICADSRTIYKGMDIGTAKPSKKEQKLVPHWGLDLVEPSDRFTVADFKEYAVSKIGDIHNRGKIPILVGGSGLYIDSVILDYQFTISNSSINRVELEAMSLEQLYAYCMKHNIILPENSKNKRYVVRAIELNGNNNTRKHKPDDNIIVVGITTDKNTLLNRIERRTEQIFDDGVVEEAIRLAKKYGWDNESMTGNAYRVASRFAAGEVSLSQARTSLIVLDSKLAKKQLTWFKRNAFISWQDLNEAEQFILHKLAKLSRS